LASLEAALRLIDDVDAPLASDDAIIAVAPAERFERVADLHDLNLSFLPANGLIC
jgi:hypothetical protein